MWRRLEPHVLEAVTLRVVGVLPAPSGHGGGGAVRLRPSWVRCARLLCMLAAVRVTLGSPCHSGDEPTGCTGDATPDPTNSIDEDDPTDSIDPPDNVPNPGGAHYYGIGVDYTPVPTELGFLTPLALLACVFIGIMGFAQPNPGAPN